MGEAAVPHGIEATVSHWLKVVGLGIEILAAMISVVGLVWSTVLFLRRRAAEEVYDTYKIRIAGPCCLASRSWSLQTSSRPSPWSPRS
jgi:hypothetical protein